MKRGHLTQTRVMAAKIYSALPADTKKEVNLPDLQEAAMLHDFGKIFIPKEILNKKGSLTPEEKEIMNLHSELGYELLKQKGIKENVLRLIKYHHQTPSGSGYPAVDSDFQCGIDLQILSVADKYSALTEERAYHMALNKEEALNIINEDVNRGLISEEVFLALKKALI